MTSPPSRPPLPLVLAIGLAVFAAGLWAALTSLPEWRQDRLPGPAFFEGRVADFLEAAGLATQGAPRLTLESRGELLRAAYRHSGSPAASWLAAGQRAVMVEATLLARWEHSPRLHTSIAFSGEGVPWYFSSNSADWSGYLPNSWPTDRAEHRVALVRAMTGTDPRHLGEPVTAAGPGGPTNLYPMPGHADETLLAMASPNWVTACFRFPGNLGQARTHLESRNFGSALLEAIPLVGRFLLVLAVFVGLAFRRRLGMHNAAILAAAVVLPGFVAIGPAFTSPFFFLGVTIAIGLKAVFLFALWSGAESWIRSAVPAFSTSLDALRHGRLGPRGGRALAGGWAVGAAQAGAFLLVFALAVQLPGVRPGDVSVALPIFSALQSPLAAGVMRAGFVLLALALCRSVLRRRWALPGAALVAAVLNLPQVDLEPWPFALAASLAANALLVFAFERFGVTGLLSAAVTAAALPAACFAATQLAWLPLSFGVTAAVSLALPVLGRIGLRRPHEPELARMGAPAFIRRIEEERRLRYEMELLSRMQKGLLPQEIPALDGYQLAATSILANEAGGDLYDFFRDDAGGLWIAAGDVAGHGLSCAIDHAMTKAALASLVKAGQRPSQILHDIDRVLRGARSVRSFTSLCLLRLDPATGEAVFSNAGHPYPLLLDGQDLAEISLPSLPLGQGPLREYRDQTLAIRQGSILVLLSDGLFESTDAAGDAYGYRRTRRVLSDNAGLAAPEILAALLADWRRHLGARPPGDDTTVVVLKRD